MAKTNLTTQQISEKLLAYLRQALKTPEIDYAVTPQPLHGGYETAIYHFRLNRVREEYAHDLVLRLYPRFYGIQNALWESKIQNILAEVGYPVARAHFICADLAILDGAFFIMDYIPGQLLISHPPGKVMKFLGKTHAELHEIHPQVLSEGLKAAGVNAAVYGLDSRFENFRQRAKNLPWLQAGAQWLFDHRPAEPDRASVCHGDFHPLNILVEDDIVTGVLDWAGFVIADPAFDVANTLVLTTIPVKYLIGLPDGVSAFDWDFTAEQYLSAYQQIRALDQTNLDYYRVRRCMLALLEGVEGQEVWQHPLIVQDLIDYIQKVTGIRIECPV